jgi:hypothetical protein
MYKKPPQVTTLLTSILLNLMQEVLLSGSTCISNFLSQTSSNYINSLSICTKLCQVKQPSQMHMHVNNNILVTFKCNYTFLCTRILTFQSYWNAKLQKIMKSNSLYKLRSSSKTGSLFPVSSILGYVREGEKLLRFRNSLQGPLPSL